MVSGSSSTCKDVMDWGTEYTRRHTFAIMNAGLSSFARSYSDVAMLAILFIEIH